MGASSSRSSLDEKPFYAAQDVQLGRIFWPATPHEKTVESTQHEIEEILAIEGIRKKTSITCCSARMSVSTKGRRRWLS